MLVQTVRHRDYFLAETTPGDEASHAAPPSTRTTLASAGLRDTLTAMLERARALVAVGHSILIAIWHMLSNDIDYQDLGPDHFRNRVDPAREALDLRQALRLYDAGKHAGAKKRFARHDSLEARIGEAFSRWPGGTVARLTQLSGLHPRSAAVQLNLGIAQFWSGEGGAKAAWQSAADLEPDTAYAVTAGNLLHPDFARNLPIFVPVTDREADLGTASLRRGSAGSAERPRGAGGSGGRPLRQSTARAGVLPPRAALPHVPEGRDRALSSWPAAALVGRSEGGAPSASSCPDGRPRLTA